MDLFDEDGLGKNMVLAKVLQVQMNDKFGISDAMIESTPDDQEMTEILQSHWMARVHTDVDVPTFVAASLRKKKSKEREPYVYLTTLTEQLRNG
jgi:hypothetical protein